MTQQQVLGPVETAVGYVLKQAAVALRNAMDVALRPLQLTVTQYSCLELLGQRPGLSNAELARGTFITRQSMNVVLRDLEERGLVCPRNSRLKDASSSTRPARPSPLSRRRCVPASATRASKRSSRLWAPVFATSAPAPDPHHGGARGCRTRLAPGLVLSCARFRVHHDAGPFRRLRVVLTQHRSSAPERSGAFSSLDDSR
jgi:hypothetical protein